MASTATALANSNILPFNRNWNQNNPQPEHYIPQSFTEVFGFKDASEVESLCQYYLSSEERYTANSNHLRDFLFLMLGINLGRRGNDTLSLKWGNLLSTDRKGNLIKNPDGSYQVLNSEYNFIRESKTGKRAPLIFNNDAIQAIHYYIAATGIVPEPDHYVFTSRQSKGIKPMTIRAMTYSIQEAAKACKITHRVGVRSTRKTYGYNVYKATGDIATVQEQFGHTSPKITLRYIGIDYESRVNTHKSIEGLYQIPCFAQQEKTVCVG